MTKIEWKSCYTFYIGYLDGEVLLWEKVGNITNLLIYVGTKKDEIQF